jgi:hypothetical protein
MSGSIEQTLFGPLSKDYCMIFMWFSLVGLLYIILSIAGIVGLVFSKKGNSSNYVALVVGLLGGLVIYLENRLFYNMCKGR